MIFGPGSSQSRTLSQCPTCRFIPPYPSFQGAAEVLDGSSIDEGDASYKSAIASAAAAAGASSGGKRWPLGEGGVLGWVATLLDQV